MLCVCQCFRRNEGCNEVNRINNKESKDIEYQEVHANVTDCVRKNETPNIRNLWRDKFDAIEFWEEGKLKTAKHSCNIQGCPTLHVRITLENPCCFKFDPVLNVTDVFDETATQRKLFEAVTARASSEARDCWGPAIPVRWPQTASLPTQKH